MDQDDEILSAREVAKMLKCSASQVYKLREEGQLRARFKLFDGVRGWRWTKHDVFDYLNARIDPHFDPPFETRPFIPVERRPRG